MDSAAKVKKNKWMLFLFKKSVPIRPLFVYFCPFLNTISIIRIEKSVDGVLGIQTRGHRMVGADNTTELCRLPLDASFYLTSLLPK